MPRPKICCRISDPPKYIIFKPETESTQKKETVRLTLAEFEALKLSDWEENYQEIAAQKMGISRQTLGNLLKSAHKKIGDFLLHGKTLQICGGVIRVEKPHTSVSCPDCNTRWHFHPDMKNPGTCPDCKCRTNRKPDESVT